MIIMKFEKRLRLPVEGDDDRDGEPGVGAVERGDDDGVQGKE